MNIKVYVDCEVFEGYKKDRDSFDRNVDLLHKISSLHNIYLFATSEYLLFINDNKKRNSF